MSRRSLRPQLNQIRGWVRQGRTDAWIAHQLDVTVQQIQAFKREQDLDADGAEPAAAAAEEVDLRAEDDAAIAAAAEEVATYVEAGVDLVIMNLPLRATPGILRPLADALAPLA